MGLRDTLAAKARGDVSTKDLSAYGRAGSDAYDLLDQLPDPGYARLCAWNAFVLQTYGDKLLAAGESPGYVTRETADQVVIVYQFVASWIARCRQLVADPAYRLDVYVPQGMPHHWQTTPRTFAQLTGMRDTFQAAQAALVSNLKSLGETGDLRQRLNAFEAAVDSVAEYIDKLWTHDPGLELRATLGATLTDGLNRAYQLGQVLAVPDLLAELHSQAVKTPAAGGQLCLPGEAGFDVWCLTDPMERRRMERDGSFWQRLEAMWQADPHPERTIAIKAEIDAGLASGAIAYLPSGGIGRLYRLAEHCPWPGVLLVKAPMVVGGKSLEPGEKFVYAVSHDDGNFERVVVVAPANEGLPDPFEGPVEKDVALDTLLAFFRRGGYRINRYGR
jgi:hypothetical protein